MLKALIVDDDIAVIQCFEQLIEWRKLGYDKIYTASNGQQAYEIAVKEKVDVIVSDLKMPIIGGVELARKLRDNNIKVEIILLTAYEDFSAAREGIGLKIYDYLLKPLVMETIERLSDDLKCIAQKRSNTTWVVSFIKDEFDGDIIQAFRDYNIEYLKELFDKIGRIGHKNEENQFFHLAIVKLIGVLCAYLKELDFSDLSIQHKRANLFELTKTLTSHKEITDILWSRISNIIEATNGNATIHKNIVFEIKKFISENYMRYDFCVSDIAKAFYYSPDHINRIFKNSEGVTASKYIINLKMEKAKQLILNSDMTVNEVARAVGYNSLSYFTSSFKNFHGITPTALREKNRNIEYYVTNRQTD